MARDKEGGEGKTKREVLQEGEWSGKRKEASCILSKSRPLLGVTKGKGDNQRGGCNLFSRDSKKRLCPKDSNLAGVEVTMGGGGGSTNCQKDHASMKGRNVARLQGTTPFVFWRGN